MFWRYAGSGCGKAHVHQGPPGYRGYRKGASLPALDFRYKHDQRGESGHGMNDDAYRQRQQTDPDRHRRMNHEFLPRSMSL